MPIKKDSALQQWIRAKRKEDMTEKEIGQILSVSHASISLYLSGKRKPHRDRLSQIAIATGIPLTKLV